ncbi:peptidylprolyl isomerase [Motiliproteus coralliicola]|uniref:Peptidyl-prolyl cis-trans isomerase n=1 Tax=Motiliproteus coralliicola TaxID=2283196 RepID=A0A369WKD4_9GAMM|nr:peptidylprolyl isomerase [Motiliproteus coralliicola]RDE22518.1 peptidylprolyl isomerase [Motiliproteus coralliicola]
MQISDNKVVSIHYTLTSPDGEVIDSSDGAEPLTYLQGHGNLISGLEKELAGKSKGDKLDVVVEPEDAYGNVVEEMIQTVPRDAFTGVDSIDVGMRFEASTAGGPVSVVVTAVDADTVTVDGNHPLAGQTLTFAVEVMEVREATEDELSHGHVHGPGCNH